MSDFFYILDKNSRKKSLILDIFETKGGGEGGNFSIVFKRQKMIDFYFASFPNKMKNN